MMVSFLAARQQQQQAHMQWLSHMLTLTHLQVDMIRQGQWPRPAVGRLARLRTRRRQLESLQQAAAACWPFSLN